MLVSDIFRLATRMFRTNKSRTVLTILGISVGIGTILFLLSLGYGLQKVILDQITTSESLLSLDVTTGDLEGLKLNDDTIVELNNIPSVEKIIPQISISSQMNVDDISTEIVTNFVEPDFFKFEGTELMKGEFYRPDDKDKIILSSATLQLFNLNEDNIFDKEINFSVFIENNEGEKFTRTAVVLDQIFRVVGIVEDENSSFVFMPYALSSVIKNANFSKIKVKVDQDNNLDVVRNAILDKGYSVSALSDIIEQANQIFGVAQIVLALFGIIALIVSAIGMFNTMTIALLERTQEIGIMKALGATSMDVWNMFLAESVIIGFMGGVGGILIGMMGGEIFNYFVNFLAGAFGGEKIDLFFTPVWFIIVIISFSTIVGMLTGFYPAKRAAGISSLEALRYK